VFYPGVKLAPRGEEPLRVKVFSQELKFTPRLELVYVKNGPEIIYLPMYFAVNKM
jgi:hypothetical protein